MPIPSDTSPKKHPAHPPKVGVGGVLTCSVERVGSFCPAGLLFHGGVEGGRERGGDALGGFASEGSCGGQGAVGQAPDPQLSTF